MGSSSGPRADQPRRRTFTAQYKLAMVAEYDRLPAGGKGALLRREGLYSSHIIEWRLARDAGTLAGPASPPAGAATRGKSAEQSEIERLRRQVLAVLRHDDFVDKAPAHLWATMPIQSQGIITRDNVSVDVSAVAYFRVVDAVKSVVAIENVKAAISQIAQTTLRKVVGQHTLDETLSETDRINVDIREILDVTTTEWGVEVTLVELKDIQLPDSMKRAMARQAEAEREKRAKIISAEGESLAAAALGDASDTMMAHPLALQLRNLQSLVEIGVDKNTTVVFPAPLMSTIGELGAFLAREAAAAAPRTQPSDIPLTAVVTPSGSSDTESVSAN
jgi:regulator of protease activity HflC (stomatin/prohibitin superfamily)